VKPIIKRVVAPGSRLIRADLVVPRHIAREWASLGARGTAFWTARYSAQMGRTVPRGAFYPPAARDAVVLTLKRQPRVHTAERTPRRNRNRRNTAS
jgi:23S rRNA (adenine-N6)-dimethyltransferase